MQKNIIHQEINETFLFTKDAILSVAKFIPVPLFRRIINRILFTAVEDKFNFHNRFLSEEEGNFPSRVSFPHNI